MLCVAGLDPGRLKRQASRPSGCWEKRSRRVRTDGLRSGNSRHLKIAGPWSSRRSGRTRGHGAAHRSASPKLILGGIVETRLGAGSCGMSPPFRPHANARRNSSSRGNTENPGLPRSRVACATRCPGRLDPSHSTGRVLNTARKPLRDSCAWARALPRVGRHPSPSACLDSAFLPPAT